MAKKETIRQITINQIKAIARRQIAESGQAGLSLIAISREVGMSGPAIYRYFPSRRELLLTLVNDAWGELGDHMLKSTAKAAQKDAAALLGYVFSDYRHWAIAHAAEYELMFSSQNNDSPFLMEKIWAVLDPVWRCLAAQKSKNTPLKERIAEFDANFPFPPEYSGEKPAVLCRMYNLWILWAHIHGLAMLEINYTFPADADWVNHLYQAEINSLWVQCS